MQVQINTDRNIEGDDRLAEVVEAVLRGALDRFSERITRVEVHLSDENSDKKFGTDDIRCVLEARLSGLNPLSVSARAGNVEESVDDAVGKLERALDTALGKLGRR